MRASLERQPRLEDLTKAELIEYIRKLYPEDASTRIAMIIYQRLWQHKLELSRQALAALNRTPVLSDDDWRDYLDLAAKTDAADDYAEAFFCRWCSRNDTQEDGSNG